ncbi:MAG: hypothetical protein IPN77_33685 [Sandaracinaceae bacterium]|nr:hypothetical protein [Sandaracinaceae bacterium]
MQDFSKYFRDHVTATPSQVRDRTTSTARNRHDAEPAASALCRELIWDSGEAPEWIQLMPIGPAVDGRDGRAWNMSDPDAVVAASEPPWCSTGRRPICVSSATPATPPATTTLTDATT